MDLTVGPRQPHCQEAIHSEPEDDVSSQGLTEGNEGDTEVGVIVGFSCRREGATVDGCDDGNVEDTHQQVGHSQHQEVPGETKRRLRRDTDNLF